MDSKQAICIASHFADQVVREFSPQEIILYGSYAKNCAKELSDIDVAIVFDEFKDSDLKLSERLWEIAWKTEGYIEPIVLDKKNDPLNFLAEVKKHGIVLYKA